MVVAKSIRWYAVPFLLLLVTATFVTAVNSELIDEASDVVEKAAGAADHLNTPANELESLAFGHGESASRPPSGVVEDVRGLKRPSAAIAEAEGSSSRPGGFRTNTAYAMADNAWFDSRLSAEEQKLSLVQWQIEEKLFETKVPGHRDWLVSRIIAAYKDRRTNTGSHNVDRMVSRSPLYAYATKCALWMEAFLDRLATFNVEWFRAAMKHQVEYQAHEAKTAVRYAEERTAALINAKNKDGGVIDKIVEERGKDLDFVRTKYNEVVARARQQFPDLRATDMVKHEANTPANEPESLTFGRGESASRPPSGVVEDVRGSNRPFAAMAEAEGSSSRPGGSRIKPAYEMAQYGWSNSDLSPEEVELSRNQFNVEEIFWGASDLRTRRPIVRRIFVAWTQRVTRTTPDRVEQMASRSPLWFSAKKHAEAMETSLSQIRDDDTQKNLAIKATVEDQADKALSALNLAAERLADLNEAMNSIEPRLEHIVREREQDRTAVHRFYNEVVARARQQFPDLRASNVRAM